MSKEGRERTEEFSRGKFLERFISREAHVLLTPLPFFPLRWSRATRSVAAAAAACLSRLFSRASYAPVSRRNLIWESPWCLCPWSTPGSTDPSGIRAPRHGQTECPRPIEMVSRTTLSRKLAPFVPYASRGTLRNATAKFIPCFQHRLVAAVSEALECPLLSTIGIIPSSMLTLLSFSTSDPHVQVPKYRRKFRRLISCGVKIRRAKGGDSLHITDVLLIWW